MNCNRCGNPIEPNSVFCRTCGSQINPTVVPQNVNQPTVVPTVVPQNTVVPKNNNNTILAIIIVMVIFIGAGVAGVTILKQTKSNTNNISKNQNVALAETTTKTVKTTKQATWNYTTTQRVDTVDNNFYKLNGVDIIIPEGYTPSYTNGMLTIFDSTATKYYLVNVVDSIIKKVKLEDYNSNLVSQGYTPNNLRYSTVVGCDAIEFDMDSKVGHIDTYLVQTTPFKVTLFMFVNETDNAYKENIIKISLAK